MEKLSHILLLLLPLLLFKYNYINLSMPIADAHSILRHISMEHALERDEGIRQIREDVNHSNLHIKIP